VLLLHIGHGCSLRTTSVLGKAAGWIQMSDVALHRKRHPGHHYRGMR
jgi:hypothetical protein